MIHYHELLEEACKRIRAGGVGRVTQDHIDLRAQHFFVETY